MKTIECPHAGFHRDATELAACLRSLVELYRERDSELRLIRAALGIEQDLDRARAIGFTQLVAGERQEARRVQAALQVALPTSESGAMTNVETLVRQRFELAAAGLAAAELLRGLQQDATDARVLRRLDAAIEAAR